jgi:hypothetical protein
MQLAEFLISSLLVVATLSGAGWVLHAEWDRARCAYLVFEKTHSRLNGHPSADSFEILISEDAEQVEGTGSCRYARERVSFKKLSSASWMKRAAPAESFK